MNPKSTEWTAELVEEWLFVAAKTERALPPVYRKGCGGKRIEYVRTWIELLWDELREDKPAPRFQPTNEQVSQWEEVVLRWLALVDSDKDKKILWMRACEIGWARIGRRVGLSRQTTAARHKRALEDLAHALKQFYTKNQ
jgi:hypothetical protein